jgi:GNAT superfamily N-acetyltransferase
MKFDELWEELDDQGVFDDYDSESVEFPESRSTDCGRTEDGKFGPKNECQGDSYGLSVKSEESKDAWGKASYSVGGDSRKNYRYSVKDPETGGSAAIKVGAYEDYTDGDFNPKGTAVTIVSWNATPLSAIASEGLIAQEKYVGKGFGRRVFSQALEIAKKHDAEVISVFAPSDDTQAVMKKYSSAGIISPIESSKAVSGDFYTDFRINREKVDDFLAETKRRKKQSRSADCERTEAGRFAAGNDCASGDGGYRGRHKAPRADGYSASADSLEGLYPDDVYSKDGGRLYGHGDPLLDNESAKIVQSLKGKPDETVRIFRAVPEDAESDIHPGDWVTINEKYAKQHGESALGGKYKIVSMIAPARHIFNDGNGIHEWGYDPKPKKDDRAFCPTGEDGGIDNSCGPDGKPASDSKGEAKPKSSGGWGRDTQKWGESAETEIWTPDKPLFSGADRLASIKIEKPNQVRDFLGDTLKMSISDAVMASGAIVDSPERASITQPRVEVRVGQSGEGVTMTWTTQGVATGNGFRGEAKEFADRKGTVVRATEASRTISYKKGGAIIKMDGFFIHPDFQGKGLALESVSRSISSPAVRLEMTAERYDVKNPNQSMTGYKVWPKYGYDAPISQVLKSAGRALPEEFSRAKTILDLFATPGGPEWWAENGNSIPLTFDNRPRSRSREVLLEYQDKSRRKNKRSVDVSKPNNEQLGTDSDSDEVLDEVWAEIQKKGLSGQSPSEADWKEWEEERTDGSSKKVRSH